MIREAASVVDGKQVEQRDEEVAAAAAEAAGLRAERHAVDAAVEELRTMLMQSVGERSRLAGEVEAAEHRIAAAHRVCCVHGRHTARSSMTIFETEVTHVYNRKAHRRGWIVMPLFTNT